MPYKVSNRGLPGSAAATGIVLLMLGACSARTPSMQNGKAVLADSTLCQVLGDEIDAVATLVEFRAEYQTDHQTYSHFLDRGCGRRGVLKLFGAAASSDRSWSVFTEHKRAICNARKATYLCAYNAVVDVVADIELRDGEPYAFVRSIEVVREIDN